MKLAAIYNVFDGEELLEGSIRQIRKHVDVVLVICQSRGHDGEFYDNAWDICNDDIDTIDCLHSQDPLPNESKSKFERHKRQAGVDAAKDLGCTHFLNMDVDEYYFSDQFATAKAFIEKYRIEASVCQMKTYFKYPEWQYKGFDNYYVPFIHKLRPDTVVGHHKRYPFYVDPTRNVNVKGEVKAIIPNMCFMHHYSWVRSNIRRKVENSTAKKNIIDAKTLHYYDTITSVEQTVNGKKLILADNHFNIHVSNAPNISSIQPDRDRSHQL